MVCDCISYYQYLFLSLLYLFLFNISLRFIVRKQALMRAIKRINALNEIKRNNHVGANSSETTQYQSRCAKILEKVRHDFLRLIIIMILLKIYLLIGTIYLKGSN